MYHVLIVDDEQLMRQYLGDNLSALCPDFCVTGIACDGIAAVELMKKQSFDVVITDIKMPEMDGLNLAKYIFESEKHTRVIIISGYSEFEYARLALKYGVSDYLLKPLSDKSIQDTLAKIKVVLDLEVSRDQVPVSSSSYQDYSDAELKSALLSSIITGNQALVQLLYNILISRGLTFVTAYSVLMLLCIDDLYLLLQEKTISDQSSYRFELNQECQSYCSLHAYTTSYDNHGNTIILLTSKSEEELIATVNTVYHEISGSYWPYEKIKISSSYGSIVTDMMNLASSYTSAAEALTLTLKDVASPISPNYYISQRQFMNELTTICDALYSDYISKNISKINSDLYLYLMLFQKDINIASFLKFGTYLVRYLAKKCNIKADYTVSAFKELTKNIDRWICTSHQDKEETHSILMNVLKALDHDEFFIIVPETTQIVESAKEYICTHYREQISLTQVADFLNVNPSYLSDLFHKYIGEPYTKFITRIRMEQAALLIRSNPNEKIYIIAEKTGFVSAKHFNSVFKKFYGKTPTEFINQNFNTSKVDSSR
ncbi:MAG: response regulator [Mobilitalea sp.]